MRPARSRIPGVGRVEVLASDTREIEVVADPGRLLAAGLTVTDVAAALRRRARSGRWDDAHGGDQHLVCERPVGSIAEIARTPLTGGGAQLTVGDVATVCAPDRTSSWRRTGGMRQP
jgi:multidrug efflux pump subunit AcrB